MKSAAAGSARAIQRRRPTGLRFLISAFALACRGRRGASALLGPPPLPPRTTTTTRRHALPPLLQNAAARSRPAASAIDAVGRRVREFLWPGASPDDGRDEPLPPGTLGCPFLGSNIFAGSEEEGPESFYSRASAELGHPRVWKFYVLGDPIASVSGGDRVRAVLGREYSRFDVVGTDPERKKRGEPVLYGSDTVMFERDPGRHQFLRRLVGEAMSPAACAGAVPTFAEAAHGKMDEVLERRPGVVEMEDVCESFTLDIAWRQILGLKLDESEVPTFHRAVKDYVSGMLSLYILLKLPGRTLTAPYRGRRYLVSKIERRIDELERGGVCDGSTMSRMLFATDDEDGSSPKLTKEEVIENCLLLMVAGTETSASTLTMAVFLLGLHPRAWEELVREQREVCARCGGDAGALSRAILDGECPYLDAVLRETMRIAPVSGGNPRRARETFVLDGKQIPKGWATFPNIRLTHELDPTTRPEEGGKAHMDVRTGFRPERWLDDGTRPSTDFLPFGAGPRHCLGAGLAMTEMKVFLAVLARRVDGFDLTGSGSGGSEVRWNTGSIIPKPKDGVPIVPRRRVEPLV